MSYQVINLLTGRTVKYCHTHAEARHWIDKQARPKDYEIQEGD